MVEVGDLAEICWGEWEGTVNPQITDLLSCWAAGDYAGEIATNGSQAAQGRKCLRMRIKSGTCSI